MFSDPEGIALMRRAMKASKLKVGDKIRITAVAGAGIPGYYIHPSTVRVFKKIISRKRTVIVNKIDEFGTPWYTVKFKGKNDRWEWHYLSVIDGENNWVRVRPRRPKSRRRPNPKKR